MNNFQREGSPSNTYVGKKFEALALDYFLALGWEAKENHSLLIGFDKIKKAHRFDIGGIDANGNKFVVECKSHKWTTGENMPSAKMTVWNEAMLYFSLLPDDIRKIFFVLRDLSIKRNITLAEYYLKTYRHLIPAGVEILEYDTITNIVNTIL